MFSGAFADRVPPLYVTTNFSQGHIVPKAMTCDGGNLAPTVKVSPLPVQTRAWAIVLSDPDAPGKTFYHWLVWNIPVETLALVPPGLPEGSQVGRNDFGNINYGGPCPPAGTNHHYVLTVYALNSKLSLPKGATAPQFLKAIEGHAVHQGYETATYQRAPRRAP